MIVSHERDVLGTRINNDEIKNAVKKACYGDGPFNTISVLKGPSP